jgi:hypothetical protein
MTGRIVFALALLVTLMVFSFTINRIIYFFRFTRPGFPVKHIGRRLGIMLRVAFGQTKIFRRPVIGLADRDRQGSVSTGRVLQIHDGVR